ncbi:MAG TPA: cation:proton antiporter [Pirellulales bacterium]
MLLQLVSILALGVGAQWVAWRVRIPSILLLLAAGIVAGPITGWLAPDRLFGDLMMPMVSLSVAVILYEGGLNLKIRELREIGGVFFRLTTIGLCITWLISTSAAHYLLHFEWQVAALLGAILVVTGPTVVGPILRHLRLRGKVAALLKWEGIIIDPLGAILAVLVFAAMRRGVGHWDLGLAASDLGLTILVGCVAGGIAAGVMILSLRRFWIPDSLYNPVSLMLMIVAFAAANLVQDEAGLLAVTVMGIVLANQKWVAVHHVVAFKETLTILLISCLFIILAARVSLDELRRLSLERFAFVAVLIVVARPLSIVAATWRSALPWRERLFLCCMAPRGIVAAAVASVMALSLAEDGFESAQHMVPTTFLVVFVTVLFYGLGAAPLARWLGLMQANPQGILFIGADSWVREVAKALHEEGCGVCLVDTDWENIGLTRMAGLPCLYGSALVDTTREQLDFAGLGRMLAVTSNNEVNSLACLKYAEEFGRQEAYQLTIPEAKKGLHEQIPLEHRGRLLFSTELTFGRLSEMLRDGFALKKTKLTNEFGYAQFQAEHANGALPLFILKPDGHVQVWTIDTAQEPKAMDTVVYFTPVEKSTV